MPTMTFKETGNFKKLDSFFERALEVFDVGILNKYGRKGVEALRAATPKDTGLLAESWYYNIEHTKGTATINFCNLDIENDCPIAIIVQYGHATRNGAWVEGVDYINPALKPIFDDMIKEIGRKVKNL